MLQFAMRIYFRLSTLRCQNVSNEILLTLLKCIPPFTDEGLRESVSDQALITEERGEGLGLEMLAFPEISRTH